MDWDDVLDFIGYGLLAAAVALLICEARVQRDEIAALHDDVNYLKDHALTRDEEVRPT